MLAVETSDDWGNAEWTVTIAAVTNVFASASATSVYDWLEEFTAWVPTQWGGKTATWAWSRNATDGGALVTVTFSHSAQIANNANSLALIGVANGTANSHTGTTSAAGTWTPTVPIAIARHARLLGTGDVGGTRLGIRPGVPGLAGTKPKVEALGTALDAGRLAGVLAVATTPRRCWIYQVHRDAWRQYALGAIERTPTGVTAYTFVLAVAGDAL